jgi:uncharacterized damage-inducible protein DinB
MSRDSTLFQIRVCRQLVKRNVGDVTHEESLRTFQPAGNCLNWVLGHLVATRSSFLRAFGGEPVWSAAEGAAYERHAAPLTDPAKARPLEEIWRAYDLAQERLESAISALTPERLAARLPDGVPVPAKTLGELVAFFGLHDAYHTGQTGLLRRLLGKPPTDI